MNIIKRIFTIRGFLIIVAPALVVIIIKLLLIKYGFDISDFINNFYICSMSLLLLNLIRFIVRDIVEKFTIPTYLFFDNPNSNPNPNIDPNAGSNANPPQNVGAIYYGNGFSYDGRVYTINDPTNVMNRGFLDPITMRPFNMSYQPYATNLSNAMAHAVQGGNPTMGMDSSIYGHNATRFYSEFMQYTYPNRDRNQY
jgi:hypothetical protein